MQMLRERLFSRYMYADAEGESAVKGAVGPAAGENFIMWDRGICLSGFVGEKENVHEAV